MMEQIAQVNVSAEYWMETKDTRTEITTVWFKVQVSDVKGDTIYIGMSKRGDFLAASEAYFTLDSTVRIKAISEVRSLLCKMY